MREKRLLLTDTAVCFEDTGRSKLTEFVTNHVLRDIDRHKSFAIVNGEVVTDEIRGDHGLTAPGFDRLVFTGSGDGVNFGEELLVNERTFFQ
jgi:hypothetical protein